MQDDMIDAKRLQRFRRNLRRWYEKNARDLPWRRTRDPYRIWISEIMLQQTTVAAVIPYYERFMEHFPDVHQLAAAPEDEVLRLWEGLGYYSRARNIHRTARQVSSELDGRFPDTAAELQKLPGIGRYTAGAIASFAFDRRAPIVEANTLRLYCRLLGYTGDPRASAGQDLLWSFADRVLPQRDVGLFNQALMELGATVCRPAEPDCASCPARSCCTAFADGTWEQIPAPKTRVAVTDVTEVSIALKRNGRFLLRRRPEGERWAGLWDFVRFEVDDVTTESIIIPRGGRPDESLFSGNGRLNGLVNQRVKDSTGLSISNLEAVAEMKHGVTRFRIRLLCFVAQCQSGRLNRAAEYQWVKRTEFDDVPLSVTGRKFARLLAGS